MEFPLISRELLFPLRLAHGLFNFSVMLLFFYTASLGLRIRHARTKGLDRPMATVKRHRKLGPVLACVGALGFFAGITLVFIDTGNILKYPAHLIVGAILVGLLATTFLISRKIKGIEASSWRQVHFFLGLSILSLYLLEVFLGLGVLL